MRALTFAMGHFAAALSSRLPPISRSFIRLPFKDLVVSTSIRCSSSVSISDPKVQKFIEKLQEEESLSNPEISRVVKKITEMQNEIRELNEMARENSELREIAAADVAKVKKVLEDLEEEFFNSVVVPDKIDFCTDVIVEVSAGVGGQEAMLFTRELLDMYAHYSDYRGWQCDIIAMDSTEIGGSRHGSLSISGQEAYKSLKFEGGVHRVQRVPKTEKSGRIHTSTSTVAIIPAPSEIEVHINPQELHVETKRASGAGGQHVNTTESAVRITHLPTGLAVECQTERSQVKNKANAMKRLRALLYQNEVDKQNAKIRSSRKLQTGMGGRNEKIRTYNYVQDRVTDHRVGLTVYNLKNILDGYEALDDIITKLMEFDKQERLEELFK